MSLKKKMFRSNMCIICLSLFSLLSVIVIVLVLFEDTIENHFFTMEQSQVDMNIHEVQTLLQSSNESNLDLLQQKLDAYDYQTSLCENGSIIQGDQEEKMSEMAAAFHSDVLNTGEVQIYYYRNTTCLIKKTAADTYLIACHFPSENTLKTSIKDTMWMWIFMIALSGVAAISVLLIVSSLFTKRMNQTIMEPLDELMLAANRISEGDLTEPIIYEGESEFEQVTKAFNTMQETILKNESARIDMVTGISHDLRTPLTSIQGYIKGVLDGVADSEEKKRKYLLTAYDSTMEMNILLQKLFDFSKLESGKLPFHFLKVDISEFVNHWISTKQTQAIFHCKQEENLFVSLDIDQFRRILENLLENSLKYAGTDPVEIEISMIRKDHDIIFSWRDNGKGVQQEKLEHIFERFYRCDESRSVKGSGVGLYVVKYITECHDGKVIAVNENGLKLIFSFPELEEKHEKNTDRRR